MIRYTVSTNTSFAIKSGGHSSITGASNIEDRSGITIDLSKIRDIDLVEGDAAVWLGTGLRWGDVYHALELHSLSVPGGRDGDVGVGGYILGGGMSWYANQVGWVCDIVLEFEVVIANGSIVYASPTHNQDLFWALKGGGSAFGVVTRFKLPTLQGTMAWGGGFGYEEDQVPALLHALEEQTSTATADTHTIGFLSFGWMTATQSFYRSVYMLDNQAHHDGVVAKKWSAIPHKWRGMSSGNISQFATDMDSKSQRGFR